VALSLPLCGVYALVCGASYFMARALPLRRTRLLPVLLSLVLASALAGGGWAGVAWVVARLLPGAAEARLASQAGILFGIGAGYFLLSLIYHYLILALEETRRAERSVDEARVLTREAELRALRAQVNPHFLFNSLNSIAALTTVAPEQARRMCQLLSDFLRKTLRLGDLRTVALAEELDLTRNYLAIEEVRFQDRMEVEERIDEDSLASQVPPLLLQPLVENAVKHGVSGLAEGGRVEVEARQSGARVVIAVENRVDPGAPSPPGSGRGLAIVEERLRSFYGDEARMVVNRSGERFRVEIRIPARADGAA
jgi:LytS/YehU family sensor histidine kinase